MRRYYYKYLNYRSHCLLAELFNDNIFFSSHCPIRILCTTEDAIQGFDPDGSDKPASHAHAGANRINSRSSDYRLVLPPSQGMCHPAGHVMIFEKNSFWNRQDLDDPWRKRTYGAWMIRGKPRQYRRNLSTNSIQGALQVFAPFTSEAYLMRLV
jgi:hypothetical protein